jgi:Carboxypeptidase regulatory-like domain/TonB dependent receptor-like, beta-barrel
MKRTCFYCLIIAVFAVVSVSGPLVAQGRNTGALEGKVLDDQGGPLPGAEVIVSSPALIGGPQSRTTNAEGHYWFVLLPPGTYAVEAKLPGFVPSKVEQIRLFVGQTLTVNLALKVGALEAEINVYASAPLVDMKSSQTLSTNLDQTAIETVAATKNKLTTGLINMAPGASDNSVMGSASRSSNSWLVDGMNLTWLANGADGNYPDLTTIQEVQVSGIGANAEFGNFTGASLNLITKSGGNRFSGLAEISYSPLGWTEKNFNPDDPKFSLYSAPPKKLWFDAHAGLGGYLIKDKLWFYLAGGQQQADTAISGFDQRLSQRMPSAFVKMTFQMNHRSRFQLYWQYEHFEVYNRGLSPVRPIEATYYDIGPDSPIHLGFSQVFSEKTFFELSAGYWSMVYEQRPNNGRDVPQHLDYETGLYSGNFGVWGREDTAHVTVNARLTHHADDFLLGSHEFKCGVEYLSGFEKYQEGYTGGFQYVDNVDGYNYAYAFSYQTHAKARKFTAFVQDSWAVNDRLTINPGLRFNTWQGTLPNVPGLTFRPTNHFEPRIGLSFDLLGDNTTALKAHYGRYTDSLKTAYFQSADDKNGDWIMYEVLDSGEKVEIFRQQFSNPTLIDPNIRMPIMDQFALSLERTLLKDVAVGATFTNRRFKDFIARVNTGASWSPEPFSFTDENGDAQSIEVYRKTSSSSLDAFLVTNPEAGEAPSVIETPKNTFTGITVFFEKRFSNKWMLHADYTYGKAKGNHTNLMSGGNGATTNYLNPNLQINSYGCLAYDPTHNLQIYGSFELPLGFAFSPRLSVRSGNPWARDVKLTFSGSPVVNIEARGSSERLPTRIDLDFRLEKFFLLREKFRFGLLFDVFNAINRGIETSVYTTVTTSYFGKAKAVNDGRYVRIGARLLF